MNTGTRVWYSQVSSLSKFARGVLKHIGGFWFWWVVVYEGGAPGVGVGFHLRLHAFTDRRLELSLEMRLGRVTPFLA